MPPLGQDKTIRPLQAAALPGNASQRPLQQFLSASPIAPFLQDEGVTDILINSPSDIYVNKQGQLQKVNATFASQADIDKLGELILQSLGRELDDKRPLADARLPDGSRVNIISPPMAIHGTVISIRKFPNQEITLEKLVQFGSISAEMANFLKLCAECRLSMLVSGGTGTGKTTMLNAISRNIPQHERIITIEDTAELRLQQPHVVTLETKESAIRGDRTQEVSMADLVRNALRMRPDRIIVGEVRGLEAFDMIQAMNTGHDGSMTTVHANTPRDAISRLENLLGPTMQNTPVMSVRRQIASAINLIIQLGYDEHGKRLITSISDVVGMEGDIPQMQDIYTLHPQSSVPDAQGHVANQAVWTGIYPRHQKLADALRAQKAAEAQPPRETQEPGMIDKLLAGL